MAVLRIQENIQKADGTYDVVHKETEAGLVLFDDNETFQQKYDAGELNGKDGKSPYQQAVEGGYTGTEAEFKAMLASGPWLPTSGGVVKYIGIKGPQGLQAYGGISVNEWEDDPCLMITDSYYSDIMLQPGNLIVANPTKPNHATTKQYVDDTVANAGGSSVLDANSVVIGPNAVAVYPSGSHVVIGDGAHSDGDYYSIAIGTNALAGCLGGIAIGYGASYSEPEAIAIGSYAAVHGYRSIAFGAQTCCLKPNSIAIGANTQADGLCSISIGPEASTNGSYCTVIGPGAKAFGGESIAIGHDAKVNSDCVVIGPFAAIENGYLSVSVGRSAICFGSFATCIGTGSSATEGSVAIGYFAHGSYAENTVCVGANTQSMHPKSIALGYNAVCYGTYSCAIGADAQIYESSNNTMQLGNSSLSKLSCSVSLTVTSDIRDKVDVSPVKNGATKLLEMITPITFHRNPRSLYIDKENLSEEEQEKRNRFGLCEYDREAHAAGTKKGARNRVGVSAQQVQAAFEAVYGDSSYANIVDDNFHDIDPETIPDGVESQLTVNYEGFIPFLIKAVQELSARVKELEESQK